MKKTEYVFGIHAIQAVLQRQSSDIKKLYVDEKRKDQRLTNIISKAQAQDIPVEYVARKALDKLVVHSKHQGVVASVHYPELGSERELQQFIDQKSMPAKQQLLLLVLDGVQDPHNLGACLRTAEGAGVDALVIPKDRAVGLSTTVRKVASGAAELLPMFQVTNLARCLRALQEAGVWIIGLAGDAPQPLYQTKLEGPLAIVMGAEAKGMRRLTKEHCDVLVSIPMKGEIQSLNVSVATGIVLYEVLRQRQYPE